MSKRKITWTKQATIQLNAAINFIRRDSDDKADKVKAAILAKINALTDDRVVHRKDLYKKNNDGC